MWGEEKGRPEASFEENTYPSGHSDVLLFFPFLLFCSDTCFILCKVRHFFQPSMTSVLYSCFYLQLDIARERGKVRYNISERAHLQRAATISCVLHIVLHYISYSDFYYSTLPQTIDSHPSVLNFPYCPMQMPPQQGGIYKCSMVNTIIGKLHTKYQLPFPKNSYFSLEKGKDM